MDENRTVIRSISFTPDTLREVDRMSKQTERTRSATVRWLIRQAAVKAEQQTREQDIDE